MTAKNPPDLSLFFKLSRPKTKPCPLGFALSQLHGVAHDQLEAALADESGAITTVAIMQWLKLTGRDFESNSAAVSAHRRKVCSCGR